MNLKMREMRSVAGMTQKQLADRLSVDLKTIGNWERGKSSISLEDACRVCDVLGCTPNDLCGWYDEHPNDRPSSSVTRDEAALIDNYRASPPEVRSTITQVARLGAGSNGKGGRDASSEAEAV